MMYIYQIVFLHDTAQKGFNLKLFMYKRGYKVSKEFVVMHQGESITR